MTKKERTSTAAISRSLTAVRAGCARTVGGGTAARAAKESGWWACCPAVVGTPGEDAAAGAAAWGSTACDAPACAWSAQSAVGHTHCCAVCSQAHLCGVTGESRLQQYVLGKISGACVALSPLMQWTSPGRRDTTACGAAWLMRGKQGDDASLCEALRNNASRASLAHCGDVNQLSIFVGARVSASATALLADYCCGHGQQARRPLRAGPHSG